MTAVYRLLSTGSICFICFLLLAECNGQSDQSADCYLRYSRANNSLNNFYKSNDQTQLTVSLAEVDSALQCMGAKPKAVELKVTLLLLLKRFKDGYDFLK